MNLRMLSAGHENKANNRYLHQRFLRDQLGSVTYREIGDFSRWKSKGERDPLDIGGLKIKRPK